ncbi:hypothetical protein ZWY2020_018828 [Hordeum vulgare]|nr:hypothetical protein ZWY2020_018828 [Hordeum vulgare]
MADGSGPLGPIPGDASDKERGRRSGRPQLVAAGSRRRLHVRLPVPYEVFTGFVRLQFELSFIDEVEKQDPAHVRTKQVIDLLSSNYGVDYPRFVALEAFEKSKHLKEDRFTIRCDVLVTERPAAQRCAGCNLRSPSLAVEPAPHACFCDVCHDASRDDPSANHCAGCHGPFTAIILAVTRLPYGHLELD